MDTETIQARFTNQEQAETAVRKLASLRADRFRLEREGSSDSGGAGPAGSAECASVPTFGYGADSASVEAGEEELGAPQSPPSSFSLSANIPIGSAAQASRVIMEAGGQMM